MRRAFLLVIPAVVVASAVYVLQRPAAKERQVLAPLQGEAFSVVEASIPEMRAALEQKRVTSRELVEQYLTRIAYYEDRLNAAIRVNPDALKDAEERDAERAKGTLRGPLHGIPIAVKDNIHTLPLPTTGGALAFEGLVPPYEATLVQNLKAAGAIVLAKTNMTELANWVAGGPTPMVNNYNGLTGYGFNPYDPRRDPRPETADGRPALDTGGSSSGSGTAANFWVASVGTETSGSILSPADKNMLVGIKPTVGRISRYGVIPITADQDTPGPMAKTVVDAAILLGAMEGAAPDPHDPATRTCTPPPNRDYTRFLNAQALRGVRIGIPRAFFYEKVAFPWAKQPLGGLSDEEHQAMEQAIAVLRSQGADVVDPADIPSVVDPDPERNGLKWDMCASAAEVKGHDAHCSSVLKYGMKRDFNTWLASLGSSAPLKTLTELREWNARHAAANAVKYGQSLLDISDEMDVQNDKARYEADRQKDLDLARERGIDAVMRAVRLDALLFPGASGSAIAAIPGYPSVIVPFAQVADASEPAFPADFEAKPSPFGVTFTAMACSEPTLIGLAYAFEQATKRRVSPSLFP